MDDVDIDEMERMRRKYPPMENHPTSFPITKAMLSIEYYLLQNNVQNLLDIYKIYDTVVMTLHESTHESTSDFTLNIYALFTFGYWHGLCSSSGTIYNDLDSFKELFLDRSKWNDDLLIWLL